MFLSTKHRFGAIIGILIALAVTTLGGARPAEAAQGQRCFRETGFCISGPIRDYWERNGGLRVFGYPIAEQAIETVEGAWTGPVQWFERDRLEDHTNEGKGVLAGRLGVLVLERQGRPWQDYPKMTKASPGCRLFPQTGHTLCEPFLSYWQHTGGLERFGYPITEPRHETIGGWSGTVQYFERRRMEHHAEQAGSEWEVMLGLLGRDLYAPPAATPERAARDAAVTFFTLLYSGAYVEAAAYYGGSYDRLLEYAPDIAADPVGNPELQGQLFHWACTSFGYQCLAVRNVTGVERRSANEFLVTLEFTAETGGLFRHPINGQTKFGFRVQKIGGRFFVMDLPPYVA